MAAVMLIDNPNVSDRLISDLIGTVTYPPGFKNDKSACGAIHGDCTDLPCSDLKQCVAIQSRVKLFPYSKK